MRKSLVISLLLILVGVGISAGWLGLRSKSKNAPAIAASSFKKACDVFTSDDAQSVLGSGTTQTPSQTDSASAGQAVTTCTYRYDPGSLSDVVNASVLLQASTPNDMKSEFSNGRPEDAVNVSGYGDSAYWSQSNGQLNVLKGQYWTIITAGSGAIDGRVPDLPRKIADIVVPRL